MLTVLISALAPSLAATPCDDPAADPWVVGMRDRVLSGNALHVFAQAQFGDAIGCDGQVTDEFEGSKYGVLTLRYDGADLTVETMPFTVMIVTLTADRGFPSEEAAVEALRAYTSGQGLDVDYETPEISTIDGAVQHQYWDPEPGLNASATIVRRGGRVEAIRFSIAS